MVPFEVRFPRSALPHVLTVHAPNPTNNLTMPDHGLVFAREDGSPLSPQKVTTRFRELVAEVRFADDEHKPDKARRRLRQVRLHDLRHGRASLLLAAETDMTTVSKLLGHSSITITADTYSHLLGGVGKAAAEAASALVPRQPRTPQTAPSRYPRDQSATNIEDHAAGDPEFEPKNVDRDGHKSAQTGCAARESNPQPAD